MEQIFTVLRMKMGIPNEVAHFHGPKSLEEAEEFFECLVKKEEPALDELDMKDFKEDRHYWNYNAVDIYILPTS